MAARGVNKVILVGNLGSDPEMRYTQDGKAIASLSLATSESWNDRNSGQQVEKTEWHRISMFGKLAEIAGQYLKKGSKVYIEGKLQTRKWQDQQGQDRYSTEVVVDISGQMQMLDGRHDGMSKSSGNMNQSSDMEEQPPAQQGSQQSQPVSPQKDTKKETAKADGFDDFDDDIPF